METKELTIKAKDILADAKETDIINEGTYVIACSLTKSIIALKKEINSVFKPIVAKAHEAHKEAKRQQNAQLEIPEQAERLLRQKITEYTTKQERIRKEKERKIQEELRKQEEERRLNEAIDTGNEEILDEELQVAPVSLFNEAKVQGVSFQELWDYEIVDLKQIPIEYMIPDVTKIRGVVKALKSDCKIPGIKVFSKKISRFG